MSKRSTNSSAGVSVDTYRDDKLYPRIVKAARTLLARAKVVALVDVLIQMGLLKLVPSAGDETSGPFGRIHAL